MRNVSYVMETDIEYFEQFGMPHDDLRKCINVENLFII